MHHLTLICRCEPSEGGKPSRKRCEGSIVHYLIGEIGKTYVKMAKGSSFSAHSRSSIERVREDSQRLLAMLAIWVKGAAAANFAKRFIRFEAKSNLMMVGAQYVIGVVLRCGHGMPCPYNMRYFIHAKTMPSLT